MLSTARRRLVLCLALLGTCLPEQALAQGSDSCATAQAISGDVVVNFVNQAATTDGLANATCNFFGQSQIELDVWFKWTATVTGTVTVSNCGQTSVDTKIASYLTATCPTGNPIACSDDSCGTGSLQTSISFSCTAAGVYLIRVGSYPGTPGGAGQITVSQAGSGPANDVCANATVISGTGSFAFNNTQATTDGVADTLCNFFGNSQVEKDVWYRWTPNVTGAHTISLCGLASIDSKVAVYSGGSCPPGAAIACNDDTCGTQSEFSVSVTSGQVYLIRLGVYAATAGGTGNFAISTGAVSNDCTPPSTGPDVIVGDVSAVTKWGLVGAICGYSLGTDSCNIGTTPLNWIASTAQHPVIGQNVYRLKAGRFEQIGMSWLKHGFLALNQNLCCPCTNPGGGTQLGVGCSDPYDSALNGNQSGSGGQGGLGPRSQVNPSTGVFPYPYAPQGSGNAIYKRVQIANADLDPALNAGALYYGEGHYIAPDDAQAGNGTNNASWRRLVVGAFSNGYDLTVTDATARKQAAIRAWKVVDPAVRLEDVPVDGLFVVGSRATDNGNGTWHYEYAVYNMNSDRGAGSFSVPVTVGLVVTNVGFHDVDSHSGEPYATTDWTPSVGAGSASWSTQTYAQNANANALRWGTLYNFRFDANAAPVLGNVTLGLFKPGARASVQAPAEIPGGAPPLPIPFCFGDGSGTACPCANSGVAPGGCANSVNASGAQLAGTGSPSISGDTLLLTGTGMPNSSALYFQGSAQQNGGLGSAFGDGLRCAAGSTIRLGTKTNAGGASEYPAVGDPSISVRGMNAAGNSRSYQVWYRNAATYCTASTFNLSNGWQLTWIP